METLTEHAVEPPVAAAPPRRLRLPRRLAFLMTVAGLLLAVFLLGCGRALWEAGELIWIGAAGRTAPGSIVEIQTEPGPEKGQPSVPVAVRYAADIPGADGRLQRRTGWIGLARPSAGGPARAAGYRIGQPVPIRYAPWFGGVASHPWRPSPAGRLTTLLLSGGLVGLVSLMLARRLTLWARDRLRLLREGVATVGTITHKRTEADDTVRYFLRYGYASAPGAGREREEQVSVEQWKGFEVGQPVTVLYDPDQPERAGLYTLIGAG